MKGDGDGWVSCDLGHTHWGRNGAAGLLLRAPAPDGRTFLLQHRVEWSHHGGTWGVPGGARDSHETAVQAARREASEESTLDPYPFPVAATYLDDHGGWSYTTVLADSDGSFPVEPANPESKEFRWVDETDLAGLPLHPGFALSLPRIRGLGRGPLLVVDAANVVGSRADGWWRDRLGAARRLRDELDALARCGVAAPTMPGPRVEDEVTLTWYPRVVLVVEGAARSLADEPGPGRVHTLGAPRSGDDAVVEAVRDHTDDAASRTVVVTADRGLRRRCADADPSAVVAGPSWLRGLLDQLGR
ncbi:MAG: NUDIX hydrolase [Streptosporangiales bacterium]|nr:NUDIX hydrolase [Streptosporangiales bacterium]